MGDEMVAVRDYKHFNKHQQEALHTMLLDVLYEEKKLVESELFTHMRFGTQAGLVFFWMLLIAAASWWSGRNSTELATLLMIAGLVFGSTACFTVWLVERVHVRRLEKKVQVVETKIEKWHDDPMPWLYD